MRPVLVVARRRHTSFNAKVVHDKPLDCDNVADCDLHHGGSLCGVIIIITGQNDRKEMTTGMVGEWIGGTVSNDKKVFAVGVDGRFSFLS
jgi:hypothetical protein